MRNRFDRQLLELNNELIQMGSLIEQAIEMGISALVKQDVEKAEQAIKFDVEVDEQEKTIEALCMKLLLQQQPVAKDLRLISAALKMITDMERIADQAVDISELVVKMSGLKEGEIPEEMSAMADAVQKMVVGVMQAFTERSEQKAREICRADDVVDECFIKIKTKLTSVMHRSGDEGGNERALDLLMVAKYLERIGDHAVNIAEWVLFSLTGEHKKLG